MLLEERFWQIIEEAWSSIPNATEIRQRLVDRTATEQDLAKLDSSLNAVVAKLKKSLEELEADDLLAFDRILEQSLYNLDREDIHEYTDGSDDGFLYARGLIVIMGQAYYRAVLADPSKAVLDYGCEEVCYISYHIYKKKFGDMPRSSISRETGANKAGWSF